MILYIIITIILLFLLYVGYYKVRYRFWTTQPIFHRYQLYNWIFLNRLICEDISPHNKYLNLLNITVKDYDQLNKKDLTSIISLLNKFLQSPKDIKNNLTIETLVPYLINHNFPVYIGLYKTQTYLHDSKNASIIADENINGIIISRPLDIVSKSLDATVNYIDTICINTDVLKEDNKYELIQTLEYKQRKMNPKIKISLYKTTNLEKCIVPFISLNTYLFDMKYWKQKIYQLPPGMCILSINRSNNQILLNFLLEVRKDKLKCFISPHITNLMELINKGIYTIYVLLQYKTIVGVYFFKTSNKKLHNKEIVECMGSISMCKNNKVFIYAFVNVLKDMNKENIYRCLQIDNIANNNIIVENILLRYRPHTVTKLYYFLYNFIHKIFLPNEVLLLT